MCMHGCDVGWQNAYFGFKWSCVLFLMNSWLHVQEQCVIEYMLSLHAYRSTAPDAYYTTEICVVTGYGMQWPQDESEARL